MNEHRRLPIKSVHTIEKIMRPEQGEGIGLESRAVEILTDFNSSRPPMLEQSTSCASAKDLMTRTHVRLNLVIDREERFKGVITLADLLSVRMMQAREKTGLPMSELSVAEVMTPRDKLHAVDISEFRQASVGDILLTMKAFGDQHMLVMDAQRNCICGIVSSGDIARALHESVYIPERANAFSDIYQAIRA